MNKVKNTQRLKELLYVTIGALLLGISINSILLQNKIVAGGANGVSIILNNLFEWNVAIILYSINIPLLIICYFLLGKEVFLKTVYGSMIYPFFVGITASVPILTNNLLLGAIYGGVTTGVGLGLVFWGNASTGGTAILAQILNKYFHISLGLAIFILDSVIIMTAMLVFNTNLVLYSLICLFIIGRVIDMVQVGFIRSKTILIISEKYMVINEMLIRDQNKGTTLIPMQGGYANNKSKMIMAVIYDKDFHKIKESILDIDEMAFIVALNASEVSGRGFSLKKITENYGVESNSI
ncbi:YitT family protein [Peptostreptococcus faecalis]|uniref:YitT family protein n=1 Tax=Peptostreptococcus faecalis TaxID=2045015 RepID=UPI000C7D8D4C|nr:YitT family protein [Peptostreptococcus faecalis]